ncbi:hypothetical protein Tco_0848358, partial [Tanacetum coccineum]
MAESSSQNPSSPEITPKEEPVTFEKPESPNPFLPTSQVDFTFDGVTFTTNNEVALLYPSHPNQKYFKDVSDFISKCCLNEAFTRAPTQYKEYLSDFWYTIKTLEGSKVWVSTPMGGVIGDIGFTTFRNALRAQYLPRSSMYVPPPSIITVDYAKIIWEDLIHKLNKKNREKIVPYPRFLSLLIHKLNSSMYVPSPSITIVRPWFATIGYRREIGEKETVKKSCLPPREKIVPYPRFQSLLLEHMMLEYENEELTINPTQVFSVHNLTLKPNQPEEPPFTDHMKAIFKLDVPVDSKAPKPSSQTEEVPKAKSLELKVDSKENDLQNTYLSPRLRHPNPKLANQKRKQ